MTTYVINRSTATLPVQIDYPQENPHRIDYVFIQPRSKAILPSLSRVTPEYAALHSTVLAVTTIDGLGEPVVS